MAVFTCYAASFYYLEKKDKRNITNISIILHFASIFNFQKEILQIITLEIFHPDLILWVERDEKLIARIMLCRKSQNSQNL